MALGAHFKPNKNVRLWFRSTSAGLRISLYPFSELIFSPLCRCLGDYGPRKRKRFPKKVVKLYEWEEEENPDNPLGILAVFCGVCPHDLVYNISLYHLRYSKLLDMTLHMLFDSL